MGVWGTSIFSDDNASDLRDDYRRLVGDGLSGAEATDRLLREWMPSLDKDPDLAATFWLALAVTQWKCGRLEDRVRQEAMRVIDDGSALNPWRGSKFERKRAAVLEATEHQLLSPQPPTRKLRRVFRDSCDWEPGELIAYRLLSGNFVVFHVIKHHEDAGGISPECEIFDWQGPEIPQPNVLEGAPMRPIIPYMPKKDYRLMIGQASKREFPKDRVFRLNAKLPIQHPPKAKPAIDPTLVCLWRDLDRQLELSYGFR